MHFNEQGWILEQFVTVQDDGNEECAQAFLEDVKVVLMSKSKGDVQWAVMMAMTVQGNPLTINNVNFDNFDQIYDTVLKIEYRLLSTAVQVEMIYSTLSMTFRRNLDWEAKKILARTPMTLHATFELV